jgi:hypothetical protein
MEHISGACHSFDESEATGSLLIYSHQSFSYSDITHGISMLKQREFIPEICHYYLKVHTILSTLYNDICGDHLDLLLDNT